MSTLSYADVVLLARKSLEIYESPDEVLPDWYLSAFIEHVKAEPNSTNFVIELAKPGKGASVGGGGFGIATCLEDYCWTDVRLSADPSLPDGGRSHGFGSLWEYQMHCDTPEHKKGRDQRCSNTGKTYLPYNPSTSSSTAAPAIARPSAAGPSRSGSTASAASVAGAASGRPAGNSTLGSSGSGSGSMLDRLAAMGGPSSATARNVAAGAGSSTAASASGSGVARTASSPAVSSSTARVQPLFRSGSGPSGSSLTASASNGSHLSEHDVAAASSAAVAKTNADAMKSAALRPTSAHNLPSSSPWHSSTLMSELDKKPSFSALKASISSSSLPARHANATASGSTSSRNTPSSSRKRPEYVELLSSDEDVLPLDEAPAHMRKRNNASAPILLSDTDSDDEQEMVVRPKNPSKPGSRKQPLFRSGSGMGEGTVNVFEEMMSSSQPRVKKEASTAAKLGDLGGTGAYPVAGPSGSLSTDIKPDLATITTVKECKFLIELEQNVLDRLSSAPGKSYLATLITRRRKELEDFKRSPKFYPRIPSGLIAHDEGYKQIAKMAEYKRQNMLFNTRGIKVSASDLAGPSPPALQSVASSPIPAAATIPNAHAHLGSGINGQPTNIEMVELRRSMAKKETAILNALLGAVHIPASLIPAVAKRRVDLVNLNAAVAQAYPQANAVVAAADRSGLYATLIASQDYKKLVSWTPPSTLGSSVIGNGAIAGPSGSGGASPSNDVKPTIASGVTAALVTDEKKAAREHVIKKEQEALNWLLAMNPAHRLRTLITRRESELTRAIASPTLPYFTIDPELIMADSSGQFKLISTMWSYRLITAWSTGEDEKTLVEQSMADNRDAGIYMLGVFPTAFPHGPLGQGSSSNAAPFSVFGGIASAIGSLASSIPGGMFDPYAAVPFPAPVPAVQHGVDCDCGEYCTYDDDDVNPALRYGMGDGLRGEDMQTFLQESFKDFSDDRTIDVALEKLGMADANAKFADMTVQLMPHQILGVSFMLDQEKKVKHRGGLLCDAMGLGKARLHILVLCVTSRMRRQLHKLTVQTVQTIATLAGNQSSDPSCKTTLIIAPLAVLTQWKAEIESKTAAGLFNVMIYHGTNKTKSRNVLKNADVVLTTYQTMANESAIQQRKRRGYGQDASEMDEDDPEYRRDKKKGILFRVKWYRIVLDEAHFIRNRNTKASKAVDMFDAVYRWSLTGTLVNNSLSDIFPHLRFLGISPQREWSEFNKSIARNEKKRPKMAAKRVQAILKTCMMRRHKDSLLNGARLLNLPPKTTEVVELEFTEEEREIYNAVEHRMKVRFGQFLRQGTVLKHMSCVLVMLMRLRQLTCHPWLLRRNPGDPAHPDDFQISDGDIFRSLNLEAVNTDADLERAVQLLGQDWVDETSKRLKERYDNMVNAPKQDQDAERDGECSICYDMYNDEVITSCRHSYCKACLHEIFENPPRDPAALDERQAGAGARQCPICRGVIERERTFAALAFFDPDKDVPVQNEDADGMELDVKPNINPKGKRKSKNAGNDGDDDEYDADDVKPNLKKLSKGKAKAEPEEEEGGEIQMPERILPSTKMRRLGELLETYLAEAGIKVIVFSEFVSYLDLVSVYLDNQDIAHECYTGKMRQTDREEVIKRFTSSEDELGPRVLLISRKAGGAGLNLTAASKVISLDLAWNAASENQSVDRAHRIGQTRPVEVQRLVIANSVEQRILELQQKKEALSDGAMGEGTGGRLGRLTVNDLMRLFDYNQDAGADV